MTQLTNMIGLDDLKVGHRFTIISAEPAMVVLIENSGSPIKLNPQKILTDIEVVMIYENAVALSFLYAIDIIHGDKPTGGGAQNVIVIASKQKNRDVKISSDMTVYGRGVSGNDVNKCKICNKPISPSHYTWMGEKYEEKICNECKRTNFNGLLEHKTTLDNKMELDKLYDDCVSFAQSQKHISPHMLQAKFNLGYMRASRIIEQLVNNNMIIGPDGNGRYETVTLSIEPNTEYPIYRKAIDFDIMYKILSEEAYISIRIDGTSRQIEFLVCATKIIDMILENSVDSSSLEFKTRYKETLDKFENLI